MIVTILGFAFSNLFFAGIVAVLPWQIDKHYSRYFPAERFQDAKDRRENSKRKSPATIAPFRWQPPSKFRYQ